MAEKEPPLLQRLKSEIQYDKLTVSFSIEGRDFNGVKKFSQFSVTVSSAANPWTPKEMPIVKALVSKQVVASTYKDAIQRGSMPKSTAAKELKAILEGLDKDIEKRVEPNDED